MRKSKIKKQINKLLEADNLIKKRWDVVRKIKEYFENKNYDHLRELLKRKLPIKLASNILKYALDNEKDLPKDLHLNIFSRARALKKVFMENYNSHSPQLYRLVSKVAKTNRFSILLFSRYDILVEVLLKLGANPNYIKKVGALRIGTRKKRKLTFFKDKKRLPPFFHLHRTYNELNRNELSKIFCKYGVQYTRDKQGRTALNRYTRFNIHHTKLAQIPSYIKLYASCGITADNKGMTPEDLITKDRLLKNYTPIKEIYDKEVKRPVENIFLCARESPESPFYKNYFHFDIFKIIFRMIFR